MKNHAGAQTWGKFKKRMEKTKKKKGDDCKQSTCDKQDIDSFNFPDGGWECFTCKNYNFSGRQKCNRCNKVKSKTDYNGKPKHLLKQNSVTSSSTKSDTSDKNEEANKLRRDSSQSSDKLRTI